MQFGALKYSAQVESPVRLLCTNQQQIHFEQPQRRLLRVPTFADGLVSCNCCVSHAGPLRCILHVFSFKTGAHVKLG